MHSVRLVSPVALSVMVLLFAGCAYYNTFYNARKSYEEAMELARDNPDAPVSMEERLLDEAVSGAAKVLAVYPDSRWADDAQLLLGDALLQSGRRTLTGSGTSDFGEAMMAYSSAIVMTDDQEVRDRACTGMGVAAMELGRYNDAIASFMNVSDENEKLFFRSRLFLMEALLLDHRPSVALEVADSLERPDDDSLAAEFTLLTGRAFMEIGMADSGAVLALSAGTQFGRGEGYYRALTTAARAYLQEERPEMAVEVLNRLLAGYRSDQETAAIALLNGKARELSGDVSGALLSYRSAADLDRYREHGAEALYRRALLLESGGRTDDAIADLEELAGRSGDYLWIRLAADRKKDLELLVEYTEELRDAGEDRWLRMIMIAEKRIDLYGGSDPQALEILLQVAGEGHDMEKAVALATLSEILPVGPDSSESLLMEAYSLCDSSDLATGIEDRLGLPRGRAYSHRPSVILERAWDLMDGMEFRQAWEVLDGVIRSPWSRLSGPELLWAAYLAGEGARIEDGILEDYLTELVTLYPETEYGISAARRLGEGETGGE
ncbi:MAG: tetratricopeptide repeat protein [Candidatus Fermentibacteraceae bacterium]|nr:tetratricopeptide repeat protein [Candidatus Fermentibacteraceae bacterium]MBN2608759.1 tetratricopeptide repeat protein [Candidatus Fermentibacteraceae bacterium]